DGFGGTDTLAGIENVSGTEFDDAITGDGGNNVLLGDDGDDTLAGGGGNDTLDGENGNDTLTGGAGDDSLTGGSGADAFRYEEPGDGTVVLTNGVFSGSSDTISDFTSGEDMIVFDASQFDGSATFVDLSAGGANQTYDGTNGVASGPAFVFDNTDTLYYDANGSADGYTVIADIPVGVVVDADITVI
ncbi:MAG: calcium-binding protein, partial [Phycisphaerae bacterium]